MGLSPEVILRLAAFLVVFGGMAVFELASPRLERPEMTGALKSSRWITNLSMVVLSSLMVRLIFPAAAVGAAVWAQHEGWGLLPALGVPAVPAGIVAFVLLDLAVWLEHVASHKVPLLWRVHRMHHADTGFDVTTGLRFHPVEILLSMVWKSAVVVVLGPPVVAVLVFEVVLNATSMFSHSNIRLPLRADRLLRRVLVTPDMHRVHHSTLRGETDSNYGFNLPIWDRLFGTYVDQPATDHAAMDIGLEAWRGRDAAGIKWSLLLPFRRNQ